ncbi:MAG: FitA-like ribbon-helix-helix domain-containing protein [Spirulinaceae cyanobacterium]
MGAEIESLGLRLVLRGDFAKMRVNPIPHYYMAQLTIQNLDEALMVRLRSRAQAEGVSVETAAKEILIAAFDPKPSTGLNLARSIQQLCFTIDLTGTQVWRSLDV